MKKLIILGIVLVILASFVSADIGDTDGGMLLFGPHEGELVGGGMDETLYSVLDPHEGELQAIIDPTEGGMQ